MEWGIEELVTAKAKAKRPLHLEKAAPSGTIENVFCELPPETKRRNGIHVLSVTCLWICGLGKKNV